MAFALCGAGACLSITLLVASSGAENVTAGNQLLVPAFAAVDLGAVLFGRPSVGATLAGTLLMSAMLNGFTLRAIPFYHYSDAFVRTVLILAIAGFAPRVTAALGQAFRRKPGARAWPILDTPSAGRRPAPGPTCGASSPCAASSSCSPPCRPSSRSCARPSRARPTSTR